MNNRALIDWFLFSKRTFSWRENRDPYRVWISETMLQQTRASVVQEYFERWMEEFPTLSALAQAPFEKVLKKWEGLGYYSRVRNLHAAAKEFIELHNGNFPMSVDALQKIKGIGPYTANAIAAFAFKQNTIAVDANVKRVLCRYYGIEDDLTSKKGKRKLQKAKEQVQATSHSWQTAEALIELGALVCSQKPKCSKCPIQSKCKAKLLAKTALIPCPKKKPITEKLKRAVFVFESEGFLLLKKNGNQGVMASLAEFPYYEFSETLSDSQIQRWVQETINQKIEYTMRLQTVNHSFTRFYVELFPFLFSCRKRYVASKWQWYPFDEVKKMSFSSGHRRVLEQIQSEELCGLCI